MLRKIIITGIVFVVTHIVYAQSVDSLSMLANRSYEEGLYKQAIDQYHQIINLDLESPELYFNLGNAYFKINDLPHAILYYEKALKLSPADESIQFNLNIANSKIPDKIEAIPLIFYKQWWNTFYNMFSANEWAIVFLGFFLFSLILILLFFTSRSKVIKKASFYTGIVVILMTIATFGLASQKYYYSRQMQEAIVFDPTITIKSSPNKNSVDLFVIHEGTKILIIDEVKDWYEIKIANGSIGWMPSSSVKRI